MADNPEKRGHSRPQRDDIHSKIGPDLTNSPTVDQAKNGTPKFEPIRSNMLASREEHVSRSWSRNSVSLSLQRTISYGDGHGFVAVTHDDGEREATSSDGEGEEDEFEVYWDGDDDPLCPRNKKKWKKWAIVLIVSASSLCV